MNVAISIFALLGLIGLAVGSKLAIASIVNRKKTKKNCCAE